MKLFRKFLTVLIILTIFFATLYLSKLIVFLLWVGVILAIIEADKIAKEQEIFHDSESFSVDSDFWEEEPTEDFEDELHP